MNGLRDKFTRWMYGRYGSDQLNRFIMIVTLAIMVISMFTRSQWLYFLAVVGVLIMYYRLLSRDIKKRGAENTKFLQATAGVRKKFNTMKSRSMDREHSYFTCPSCGQKVRVPRGKGKISITCPKCHSDFVKRT